MKKLLIGTLLAFSLISMVGCSSGANDAPKSAKCGEGKCGGDAKKMKSDEGKCGGDKKEAKKCGGDKTEDKKCGEGKCGGSK
jgi:uncharacterized low-complexity protein